MQATSDKDVSARVYHLCLYVCNLMCSCQKAEVYWFTLYASVYRQRQRNGFSSFAICVFTLVNVGTAACTLGVHIYECRSFKG
jgi:hypothetical protein